MSNPKYVGPEHITSPLPALAAGKTGTPTNHAAGGAKAVGKIVFTGNIIANDTITINSKVFTAKASGASGEFEFNVGVSLDASLDSLITVLNACTDPLVSYATYTKTDTNTAVTSTSDRDAYSDNAIVLASNHSTVVVTQPVGGQDAPAISLETESTNITNAAGTERYSLAAGDLFQKKTIYNSGGGVAVISGDFTSANTTLTLDSGEYQCLQWLGEWKTIAGTGALS